MSAVRITAHAPNRKQAGKQALLALTVVSISTGVLWLAGRAIVSALSPYDNLRFSQSVWATANPDTRTRMTEDLVRHHLKLGMTQVQVVALLGKPERIDDALGPGDQVMPGRRILDYNLGPLGDWFQMDTMHLKVGIDQRTGVFGVHVVQH